MKKIQVWDLPTRVLHWLFTTAVAGALGVALTCDDEGGAFRVHMLLGLVAGLLALLRLAWGLVGARYARLRSFLFGPRVPAACLLGAPGGPGPQNLMRATSKVSLFSVRRRVTALRRWSGRP